MSASRPRALRRDPPTGSTPAGEAALRGAELTERGLGRGGVVWAAGLPDFDSRPGRVRETLLLHRRTWLALLVGELACAVDTGEVARLDVDLTVFQIDAVLNAANTALRLGESDAVFMVRRVIDGLLAPPH
ncbi:TetR family transcriptional regulator C-terminal domain-containing protein [Streptomyces sp. NPDC007808]|uniref:TetR family transcriptional regulator C-terminal domain-containing protein n=1 Tax=Streptomyces sp. NPDC007808 TaxID=3364779 RepID=UPI0036B2E0A7